MSIISRITQSSISISFVGAKSFIQLKVSKDPIFEVTQSSILKMAISTISRTGREMQRYNQGCRQVVGCVPYKYNGKGELEVLLVSSQKGEHKMFFPKGGWEIDESIKAAAERETFEEAGVRGDIKYKLGKWMFKSKRYGTYYEGSMFSLFVREQPEFWPEKDVRTRRWMTVEEARQICQPMWMLEALDELVCHLTPSEQS